MIIGLTGKKRSGKTTVANLIQAATKSPILSFAGPLKEMIEKAGICTHEELYSNKTEFSRRMLQKIGTDIFRNQVDRRFWIKRMKEKIFCDYNDKKIIVIDDIRFKNEAQYVKTTGGKIVCIYREDTISNIDIHESEIECELIVPDWIIENNLTLEELNKKVSEMLLTFFPGGY